MEGLRAVIEKISKESGKSFEELTKLIEDKKDELSGLVSEEGAAYIVGRELGVSLLKDSRQTMKVKNLVDGLSGIDILAKIVYKGDVREFDRDGKKGRVLSLTVGDETGTVRLPLWNQEVEQATELQADDTILISGAWVKKDQKGGVELRISKGRITKSAEKVGTPPKSAGQGLGFAERKTIAALKEGDMIELRACIVSMGQKEPFYLTCPQCRSRVTLDDGAFHCAQHGEVKPDTQMVVSAILDDSTGNIRAVFFRNVAEQLFGKTVKELQAIKKKEGKVEAIFEQFTGMGKDFLVRGRVKKNSFKDALELVVNDIAEMNPKEEGERLLKELA